MHPRMRLLFRLINVAAIMSVVVSASSAAEKHGVGFARLRSLGSDVSDGLKLQWFVEDPDERPETNVVVEVSNEGGVPLSLLVLESLRPRIVRGGRAAWTLDVWTMQYGLLLERTPVDIDFSRMIESTGLDKKEMVEIVKVSGPDCRLVGPLTTLHPGEKLVERTTVELQEADILDIGVFSLTDWYLNVGSGWDRHLEKDGKFWAGALYLSISAKELLKIRSPKSDKQEK